MWKTHKKSIVLAVVVILLPILAGVALWDQLPQSMPIHFGVDNQPNGWAPRPFAVFGMPVIMAALELLAVAVTSADPRHKQISDKAFALVLWIIPVMSVVLMLVTYAASMGQAVPVGQIVMVLLGVIFMACGNYLPKSGQNHSLGVRIPWTLEDPENWRATHRVAAWCFIVGGLLIAVLGMFFLHWLLLFLFIPMTVIPVLYSYWYYRKHGGNSHAED